MAIPSANELTNEQQDAALQKLEDIFNREDRRSTKDYVVTIKNTMFFRPGYNWDELLTATPTIGMLLAAVVLSLPTKDAEEIRVLPPSTGFTHLRYASHLSIVIRDWVLYFDAHVVAATPSATLNSAPAWPSASMPACVLSTPREVGST